MENNFDPFEQLHKNSDDENYLKSMLKYINMDIEKVGNESSLEIQLQTRSSGKTIETIREEKLKYFGKMKTTVEDYLQKLIP